jgi:pimeloyl-ACP methyl ester carboxylesterase
MTNGDTGTRIVRAGDAAFSYLEAGGGPSLVLLHGIGSAAASFRYQLETLSARFQVLAWDAPGYGASTPLATEHPGSSHYAAALDAWLAVLGVDRCHVLGHSLGTLIAARFVAERPRRVISLTLASIAKGHGPLPPAERQRLLAQRLDDLAELGPHGMAAKRGPRLLGPAATEEMQRMVVATMARIHPDGYAQAARLLSTGDIAADIARAGGLADPGHRRRGRRDHTACHLPGDRSFMLSCLDACHPRCWPRRLPGEAATVQSTWQISPPRTCQHNEGHAGTPSHCQRSLIRYARAAVS